MKDSRLQGVTKFFVFFVSLLFVFSLVDFPVVVADQAAQDQAMDFMEQVLPINLSKYTITLRSDTTRDLLYKLSSGNRKLDVTLTIENGIIYACGVYPMEGQAITKKHYSNLRSAVTDFLETYQAYTKIDSNNLITMLNNVDLTKNSTITTENTKLTINSHFFGPDYLTHFRWEHIINGAAYDFLDFTFDENNLLLSIVDTRALYTVGDGSVNVSEEQAVSIVMENLKYYSYELSDGSVVKGFKSPDEKVAVAIELKTIPVNYELRPYWDVRIFLNQVAPGNVFAISAFVWADTGEIISYGNMATGGTYVDVDDSNLVFYDVLDVSRGNVLMIIIVAVIIVGVVVALVIGLSVKKRCK